MEFSLVSKKKVVETTTEKRVEAKTKVRELPRNIITEAFVETLPNLGYTKESDTVYSVKKTSTVDKRKFVSVLETSSVCTIKETVIEVVESITETITIKEGFKAEKPKADDSIEAFLESMMRTRQENPFARAESKDNEPCDCPACQMKAMITGALKNRKNNPDSNIDEVLENIMKNTKADVKIIKMDGNEFFDMMKNMKNKDKE